MSRIKGNNMINKIKIDDLTKLKITSVKSWCVNFTYNGIQYFIHDDSDEDRCMGLYKKSKCNSSERINGRITLDYPTDFIELKYGKVRCSNEHPNKYIINYNQIDKEYFVMRLTKLGFAYGLMEDKVKECDIKQLQNQIDRKVKEIEELKNKIRKIENLLDK